MPNSTHQSISLILIILCVYIGKCFPPASSVLVPIRPQTHAPDQSFFKPIIPYSRPPEHQTIGWKNQVALKNIFSVPKHLNVEPDITPRYRRRRAATSPRDLNPGDPAPAFSIVTTQGVVRFPQKPLSNVPIVIHAYDKRSGFLEALWNTPQSFDGMVRGPANAHYIFLSTSLAAYSDANWMRRQIVSRMEQLHLPETELNQVIQRMHFGTTPLFELGNWIPDLLKEWRCEDHNCGYYQAVFVMESTQVPLTANTLDCLLFDDNCNNRILDDQHQVARDRPGIPPCSRCMIRIKIVNFVPGGGYLCVTIVFAVNSKLVPIVLKRQDARYDWLPNMFVNFGSRSTPIAFAGPGCQRTPSVNRKIALVLDGGCTYFKKVWFMQQSGALGVIVVGNNGDPIHDMNCQGGECSSVMNIPATMIPYDDRIMSVARQGGQILVKFQTTQSDNFYLAIDRKGRLQEMGWLLYPSFSFFAWEVEGMDFVVDLENQIVTPDVAITVFNRTKMHGDEGAFAPEVPLPWDGMRIPFSKLTLDLELKCPHGTDRTCAEWDHTVHLFVCCDPSPLCGMELGRWISPYRRQSGRWLTDASHLLPLLSAPSCNFTMKHPPWTDAWYPILRLYFAEPITRAAPSLVLGPGAVPSITSSMYPDHIEPMFVGSETFDLTYNTKFPPFTFILPGDVKRCTIYAMITGHGSDNNNCAEFCVTSHNFLVNQANLNSRVFTNAGTPFGCAQRVKQGVEPNQHGTWLYGRNGWCPGENIQPWIVDITDQLRYDQENQIRYFGHYNGTDPNPTSNPGNIIISAYLCFWKDHSGQLPASPYQQIALPRYP